MQQFSEHCVLLYGTYCSVFEEYSFNVSRALVRKQDIPSRVWSSLDGSIARHIGNRVFYLLKREAFLRFVQIDEWFHWRFCTINSTEKKTVFDKNVKKIITSSRFLDFLVFKNGVKYVIYTGFNVAKSENII